MINRSYNRIVVWQSPFSSHLVLYFQVVDSDVVKSRYNITRPVPGKDGAHRAGPFDMGILIDTLTKVRQAQATAPSHERSPQAQSSVAGLKTIIAKNPDSKRSTVKTKKFIKDVTLKPKSQPESPCKTDPFEDAAVSLSHVKIVDCTADEEQFNKTLVDIQQKTATEAFNVMQMIVRTMTGIFPVCIFIVELSAVLLSFL